MAPHSLPSSNVLTARIDIGNPRDLLAWAQRLDVPASQISDAVLQVGDDANAVALVLKGSVAHVNG